MRCDAIRISVYSGKVCIRAGKSLLAGSVLFIRPGPPRSIHEAGARRTAVTSDTAPPLVAIAQPWRRPTLTPVLRRASAVRLVNYSLVHVWCPDRGVFAAPGQPPGGPGRSGAVPRGARRRRALLAAGPPRSLRRCSPSREQRAGIGAVRYQGKGHKIAPVPVLSAFTTGSCISISAVIIIYHRQQRGLGMRIYARVRDCSGRTRHAAGWKGSRIGVQVRPR